MTTALDHSEPQLAPPGAGLPKVELFFARLLVRWKSARTSRTQAEQVFATQREAILKLVRTCDSGSVSRPVLIKRLPGLEDSSRHWSVLMTLDHLRIVNSQIASVIALLNQGQVPGRATSTAAVKPDRNVDASVVEAFEQGCASFEKAVSEVTHLTTSTKFAHPWFGPMNAAEWHFMAGFHMDLHRRQMECILAQGAPHPGQSL